MEIVNTNYGKKVYIFTLDNKEDWAYAIRNVKVLNGMFERKHPCIDMLAKKEAKLEKKLLQRLQEMDDVHRKAFADDSPETYCKALDEWEKSHKGVDYNVYFHDTIRELLDQINGISDTYCKLATRDGYGWCW